MWAKLVDSSECSLFLSNSNISIFGYNFSLIYQFFILMNRFLLILIVVLSALLYSFSAKAQFDVHFNQYWALKGFYNPAWAGQTDKLNIAGTYSMQFMNFIHAPKSMYFGADMPFSLFNKKHGAGAGFFNESIGLYRNQRVWLQYAYQHSFRKGRLGIGVQVGLINVSFDPANIKLGEDAATDPAFPTTEQTGSGLDLGVGAFYSHPKFYVGFSGQHLTAPTVELGDRSKINIKPAAYFTAGYNIQTRNPLVSIQPSVLLQSNLVSTRVDLTGRLLYTFNEKVFSGGLTYAPGTSIAFILGGTIRGVTVGYTYELYTSNIGAASGSHDLVISYAMDINLFKKSKNKHKSVRIL